MVNQINSENVDLVVITGDIVVSNDKELYDIANRSINKIRHNVIVLPGEYDYGPEWESNFGSRYKYINIGNYILNFLDTSFLGHKFFVGWGDTLKDNDIHQYNWLLDSLKVDKYHIIFSHHPFLVDSCEKGIPLDNIRVMYSGHLHEISSFYFKYEKPRGVFEYGFGTTYLKFHGSACYLLINIDNNDNISHVPKFVDMKKTAW